MKRFFAKLCVLSMAALCILAGCSNEKEKADASKKEQAAGIESSMETIGVSRLSTTNNRVVDENGNPYVIRGISTHGIAWFPEIINEKIFRSSKRTLGSILYVLPCIRPNQADTVRTETRKSWKSRSIKA